MMSSYRVGGEDHSLTQLPIWVLYLLGPIYQAWVIFAKPCNLDRHLRAMSRLVADKLRGNSR